MFDGTAAQRRICRSAPDGDFRVFTDISYPAKWALSKRSKTPYVVTTPRFTGKLEWVGTATVVYSCASPFGSRFRYFGPFCKLTTMRLNRVDLGTSMIRNGITSQKRRRREG